MWAAHLPPTWSRCVIEGPFNLLAECLSILVVLLWLDPAGSACPDTSNRLEFVLEILYSNSSGSTMRTNTHQVVTTISDRVRCHWEVIVVFRLTHCSPNNVAPYYLQVYTSSVPFFFPKFFFSWLRQKIADSFHNFCGRWSFICMPSFIQLTRCLLNVCIRIGKCLSHRELKCVNLFDLDWNRHWSL